MCNVNCKHYQLYYFALSLKKLVNLSVKIQDFLKKLITQITEILKSEQEFNGEPISMLCYKNRKEQPKVFRQPTLIYPVTLQEFPNDRGSVIANWTLYQC